MVDKEQQILEMADFCLTINHIWTKARLRDIKAHGFGIKEIYCFDTPKEFPQSGFQFGMVWLKKGYKGRAKISWRQSNETQQKSS